MDAIEQPSSCAHCGVPERHHGRRWTLAAGVHGYERPGDATVLIRMRLRRERRRDRGEQR